MVDGIRSRIQEVVKQEYANSSFESISPDAYHVWAAHNYWAIPWFDHLQELIAANESSNSNSSSSSTSSGGGEGGDLSR